MPSHESGSPHRVPRRKPQLAPIITNFSPVYSDPNQASASPAASSPPTPHLPDLRSFYPASYVTTSGSSEDPERVRAFANDKHMDPYVPIPRVEFPATEERDRHLEGGNSFYAREKREVREKLAKEDKHDEEEAEQAKNVLMEYEGDDLQVLRGARGVLRVYEMVKRFNAPRQPQNVPKAPEILAADEAEHHAQLRRLAVSGDEEAYHRSVAYGMLQGYWEPTTASTGQQLLSTTHTHSRHTSQRSGHSRSRSAVEKARQNSGRRYSIADGNRSGTSRGRIEARNEKKYFKMMQQIPQTSRLSSGEDDVAVTVARWDFSEVCRAKAEHHIQSESVKSPKKKFFGMSLPSFRSSTSTSASALQSPPLSEAPAVPALPANIHSIMPSKAAKILGTSPPSKGKKHRGKNGSQRADTAKSLPSKWHDSIRRAAKPYSSVGARPLYSAPLAYRPSKASPNAAPKKFPPGRLSMRAEDDDDTSSPPTPPKKDTPPYTRAQILANRQRLEDLRASRNHEDERRREKTERKRQKSQAVSTERDRAYLCLPEGTESPFNNEPAALPKQPGSHVADIQYGFPVESANDPVKTNPASADEYRALAGGSRQQPPIKRPHSLVKSKVAADEYRALIEDERKKFALTQSDDGSESGKDGSGSVPSRPGGSRAVVQANPRLQHLPSSIGKSCYGLISTASPLPLPPRFFSPKNSPVKFGSLRYRPSQNFDENRYLFVARSQRAASRASNTTAVPSLAEYPIVFQGRPSEIQPGSPTPNQIQESQSFGDGVITHTLAHMRSQHNSPARQAATEQTDSQQAENALHQANTLGRSGLTQGNLRSQGSSPVRSATSPYRLNFTDDPSNTFSRMNMNSPARLPGYPASPQHLHPVTHPARLTTLLDGYTPLRSGFNPEFTPNCPSAVPSPLHSNVAQQQVRHVGEKRSRDYSQTSNTKKQLPAMDHLNRPPVHFPEILPDGSHILSHFFMTNSHIEDLITHLTQVLETREREMADLIRTQHGVALHAHKTGIDDIKAQIGLFQHSFKVIEDGNDSAHRKLDLLLSFVRGDILNALHAQTKKTADLEDEVKDLQDTVLELKRDIAMRPYSPLRSSRFHVVPDTSDGPSILGRWVDKYYNPEEAARGDAEMAKWEAAKKECAANAANADNRSSSGDLTKRWVERQQGVQAQENGVEPPLNFNKVSYPYPVGVQGPYGGTYGGGYGRYPAYYSKAGAEQGGASPIKEEK